MQHRRLLRPSVLRHGRLLRPSVLQHGRLLRPSVLHAAQEAAETRIAFALVVVSVAGVRVNVKSSERREPKAGKYST